jgi:hypothetical protein
MMSDLIHDINTKQESIITQKLYKNKIKNDFETSRLESRRQAKIDKKSVKRSLIDQIKNSLRKKKKPASTAVSVKKRETRVRFEESC